MLKNVSGVLLFAILAATGCSVVGQVDCDRLCEDRYPYIEEIYTGPLIELSDSTVSVQPNGEDSGKYIGYYYRVLTSNLREWGSIVVDKVSVIRTHAEYDVRVVDTSYSIDYPWLLKKEGTEVRFIEWSSATSFKVELYRRHCYEFSLDPDPAKVTVKHCK